MLNLTSRLDLECFSASYASARQRFLATVQRLPSGLLRSQDSFSHPLAGPEQETLACDVLQLGQSAAPQRLLVLMCGTHGVEGFAGSAIQSDCLPLLAEVLQRDASLGVVMIHAFNPWGFAWLRRCDHQGIDLNRNFVDFSAPLPDNPGYDQLHRGLLQCAEPGASIDADGLDRLWQDMGLAAFTEVVTRGQYRHDDGLFYGGNAPSWSRTMLARITAAPLFAAAQRIAVIDLHTGLGPYGYGEVINDHPVHSAGFQLAQDWYGDNARSTELGESVSACKQGLLDFHWHRLMGERGCFVTLEFGTYAGERLLRSLINEQVLHNRWTQSGAARDLHHEQVQQLKRFFSPAESSWQQQVLFRARQVVSLALQGMLV